MMFKCGSCGRKFDGKDPNPFYNAMATECPCCGSDRIVEFCAKCGRVQDFTKTEFFGNFCRDCLMQKLTYETGHDFLLDCDYLVDFVFDRLLGAFAPTGQDPERKAKTVEIASKLYKRQVCHDLLCDETKVMQALIEYIFDDDPMFGESFAEWAEKREGLAV